MNIKCDKCDASYRIADEKIAGRKAKIRCKKCSNPIIVDGTKLGAAKPVAKAAAAPAAKSPTTPPPSEEPLAPQTIAPEAPDDGGFGDDEATQVMSSPLAAARLKELVIASAGSVPRQKVGQSSYGGADSSQEPESDGQADDGQADDGQGTDDEWQVNISDDEQQDMSSEQIVAAWKAGKLTDDSFVWRDGMDDWLPVLQVPELALLLEGVAAPAPAPMPATSDPFGSSAAIESPFAASGDEADGAGRAARVSEESAPDLFGNVEQAGSERESLEEAGDATGSQEPERATGARNESSVLFSLDALKAGVEKNPEPAKEEIAPDSLIAMGGLSGGGLFSAPSADALASAATEPPPPPDPVPMPMSQAAAPSVGVSGPPGEPAKGKGSLIIGAVVLLLLIAGSVGAYVMFGSNDKTSEASPGATPTAPAKTAETTKPAEDEGNTPPPTPGADAETATKEAAPAADAGKAAPTEDDKKRFAEAQAKEKEAKAAGGDKAEEEPGEEEKPAEEEKVAPPFNVGAAKAALSAAAGGASGCKKPDGPTGTGRVVVTFAPSGRATSANVAGAFAGTPTGGCVASVFRRAKIPAFSGGHKTVGKSFTIN